jgi:hypothetical protein
VNARPVAQNIMKVEPREIAAAPVSHLVRAEPIRTSVIGTGRPVTVRPPAAVISRPVVAVRTPPAPPRPIEQRQTQAGGHLNEQSLVRPAGPAQPAQMTPGARPTQSQNGFRPFTPANSNNNNQVRQMPQTQPRIYEQQGTPQPENRNVQPSLNRMAQPDRNQETYRPPQQQEPSRSPMQETHPLVRPTPPVQERNQQQEQQQAEKFHQWQQTRPTPPPPAPRPESRPSPPPHSSPPPKQEKPKGH